MISEDLDRQWQLRGDHYMSLTTDVNLTVARPSASGYGGGYTSTVSGELSEFTSHYQGAFAEIRSQIDTLIRPWRDLPSVASLADVVDDIDEVAALLNGDFVVEAADLVPVVPNEALTDALEIVHSHISGMGGGTIAAFKEKFLIKLQSVVDRYFGISAICKNSAEAEREIWQKTEQRLVEIVEAFDGAMTAIANSGTPSVDESLGILKFALNVASFVPGPVGAGAKAGSSVFKLTELVTGKKFWTPQNTSTYSAQIQDLTNALSGLQEHARSAESELRTTIRTSIAGVQNNPRLFDLQVDPPEDTGEEVVIYANEISNIVNDHLPTIYSELKKAATTNDAWAIESPLTRQEAGLAPAGAASEITELQEILSALLLDLAVEVAEGSVQLGEALKDFIDVEEQVVDDLEKYIKELDGTYTDDPLHDPASPHSRPIPPPHGFHMRAV